MIDKSKAMLAAFVLAAAPALVVPAAAADTYKVDKNHSQVLFTVKHLVSKVTGRFQDFEGQISIDRAKPEASTAEFVIKTASVDTNVARRDDHLRSPDFFDAVKNPEITFKSTKVTPRSKDAFDVAGDLTIRGVTKPVVLAVSFLGDIKDPQGAERAGFDVATTINRKDFGVSWNRALDQGGFMLGDDVTVAINLETVKQKPEAAK